MISHSLARLTSSVHKWTLDIHIEIDENIKKMNKNRYDDGDGDNDDS